MIADDRLDSVPSGDSNPVLDNVLRMRPALNYPIVIWYYEDKMTLHDIAAQVQCTAGLSTKYLRNQE